MGNSMRKPLHPKRSLGRRRGKEGTLTYWLDGAMRFVRRETLKLCLSQLGNKVQRNTNRRRDGAVSTGGEGGKTLQGT